MAKPQNIRRRGCLLLAVVLCAMPLLIYFALFLIVWLVAIVRGYTFGE
jgi:hypothetical protein